MAQEDTSALTTNNSTGGLFGSFFGGLTDLVKGAAPVAANLYTLKMQGQQLSQQTASQAQVLALQQQQELAKAAGTKPAGFTMQPWMYWLGGGLVLALIALLVVRRRS
jgi:hypothetical protein